MFPTCVDKFKNEPFRALFSKPVVPPEGIPSIPLLFNMLSEKELPSIAEPIKLELLKTFLLKPGLSVNSTFSTYESF